MPVRIFHEREARLLSIAAAFGGSGFTLIEMLVVIAVLGLLAAMLIPALIQGQAGARRVQCLDNLRQVGLATRVAWDDREDMTFPYLAGATNGGRVYWFGWLKPGAEGQREFDPTQGLLHPYLQAPAVLLCPSLDYQDTRHKLKAVGAACNYGYNYYLGRASISVSRIVNPSQTVLFADAAQVNDFQAPASPDRPLLEEFYYVDADADSGYPNAHFRHNRRAQTVSVDGHVELEAAVPGSYDSRLPAQGVGRLRRQILRLDQN